MYKPSRVLIYAVLTLGSLAFGFPFFWMILTSVKQQNEMSPSRIRLLPRIPTPVGTSPYVDETEFKKILPEEISSRLWNRIYPELHSHVQEQVSNWLDQQQAPPFSQFVDKSGREELVDVLVAGIIEEMAKRLSDKVRGESKDLLESGKELDFELWKIAVFNETDAIITPAQLLKLSEESLRSFQMGMARIQMKDGKSEIVNPDRLWTLAPKAEGVSVAAVEGGTSVAYRLNNGDSFDLLAQRMGGKPATDALRSFFVGLKGDESWAQVDFIVTVGGKSYRSEQSIYLWNSEWREVELRFPAASSNVDSRTYLLLKEVPFQGDSLSGIRVVTQVSKLNVAEAWVAKVLLNYHRAAGEIPLVRYFATSVSLVLLNVLLMVFACTLAGYAFARLEWPGRDLFFGILLATMMIPAQVTMIPNFLVIREIGWFNTLLPLWVPAIFGAPYFIFLVRQFLKNVPKDLEEAALMDGCGFIRIYWHVMLPLIKPTIASIAIFTFIGSWNNFFGPLIYLNDDRLYPMALGLFRLNLSNSSETGLVMAASFIMTMPVIIIFFFLQRFFIQGMALSGTKE